MREGTVRTPEEKTESDHAAEDHEHDPQLEEAARFALGAGAVLAGVGAYILGRKKKQDDEED